MAIIISDNRNGSYDGNISTVNGFYRAEAGNLGALSAAAFQSLTSTFTIPVTFANAGNCMGLVLPIAQSGLCNRPLNVDLQELVLGVWTTRASKSLTALEIAVVSASGELDAPSSNITAFKFATPYTVNTTVGIWRFQITSTAGTGTWFLKQAVAGTPAFVTWCDNQISWTDNNDQFVVVDDLIINANTTFKAALATGDTINGYAGWVCSGTDRTPTNCPRLKWKSSPTSSYSLTISGLIAFGCASGIQIGTSSSPIPSAYRANIILTDSAVGTNTQGRSSGLLNISSTDKIQGVGGTFVFYGEIPAVEDTELFAPALAGQPVIVTKDVTGWVAGDVIAIGRQTTRGNADNNTYIISSVAGDGVTITLTTNIAGGGNRAINASVIRLNGYGIKISSATSNPMRLSSGLVPHNLVFSGCELSHVQWTFVTTPIALSYTLTDMPFTLSHCSISAINSAYSTFLIPSPATGYGIVIPYQNFNIDHVNCHKTHFASVWGGNLDGKLTITNCILINKDAWSLSSTMTTGGFWEITDCKIENCAGIVFNVQGINPTFKRNKFWGCNGTGGALTGVFRIQSFFSSKNWSSNIYDNCNTVFLFSGINIGNTFDSDELGQISSNTANVWYYNLTYTQAIFKNCKGNVNLVTNWLATAVAQGSELVVTSDNQVTGADSIYRIQGSLFKSGVGLSDTTTHNNDYCLKCVPSAPPAFSYRSSPLALETLKWSQSVPTENIQGLDMAVGIWIKMDNANYWAGTHQMPRINVNYDNGTVVYAEALQNTDWQFVYISFQPATTYGEIIITVDGKTDAGVANSIFYVAEMSVLYPAGHNIEMGKMNTWSNSLPTVPSISTTISASDVWAVDPTQFGAATVGDKVNKIKKIVTGLQ